MLVLTRSCDEEIRIGDEVVVRVLDVKGDRVRIGISAPAEIAVHRQEVYEEIERANRESVQVESAGLAGAQRLLEQQKKSKKKQSKSKKRKESVRAGGANTEVTHGT